MILAPSRTGFMVLILWGLIIFVKKSYWRVFLIPLIILIAGIILFYLPFGSELFSIFSGDNEGVEIRNGHIASVLDEFKNHPITIFTGEGPGSFFYTKGRSVFADNIEISQLEYLRKYGVIGFLIFNIVYFAPLFSNNKKSFYLKGTLVVYYFVAFSNPVLFSIFAMMFLTYAYLNTFNETVKMQTAIHDDKEHLLSF